MQGNDCSFDLQWKTKYACRLCRDEDYIVTKGKCIGGKRSVVNKKTGNCIASSNSNDYRDYRDYDYYDYYDYGYGYNYTEWCWDEEAYQVGHTGE